MQITIGRLASVGRPPTLFSACQHGTCPPVPQSGFDCDSLTLWPSRFSDTSSLWEARPKEGTKLPRCELSLNCYLTWGGSPSVGPRLHDFPSIFIAWCVTIFLKKDFFFSFVTCPFHIALQISHKSCLFFVASLPILKNSARMGFMHLEKKKGGKKKAHPGLPRKGRVFQAAIS